MYAMGYIIWIYNGNIYIHNQLKTMIWVGLFCSQKKHVWWFGMFPIKIAVYSGIHYGQPHDNPRKDIYMTWESMTVSVMLIITIDRIINYHRHHHYLHHIISHAGKSYYWSTNVVIIELVRPWVSYVWSISGWIDGITREVSNQFLLLQGEFL